MLEFGKRKIQINLRVGNRMLNFFKKGKRISEKNIYKIIKKSFDKDHYIKTHKHLNTDLEPLTLY